MKSLIVGNGARESALAEAMGRSSSVYAIMEHMNPSISDIAERTKGKVQISSVTDAEGVARFAEKSRVDVAMVSADSPLEAGVVDALRAKGIPTVGPDREGARIEWDKTFSRHALDVVAPEANPLFRIGHSEQEIDSIFNEFGDMPVAVKPKGLTGGKGVKVVGPHLRDNEEAKECAKQMLRTTAGEDKAVIIEEKIEGVEFTLQAISDGKTTIFPPASYDYPYRFDGDTGPGTGGMGAYTLRSKELPFMSLDQYGQICDISIRVVNYMDRKGLNFSGVLNGGFFITKDGKVKVTEFNARFGDPECANIMSIINEDWIEIMQKMASRGLKPGDITFRDTATSLNYLVAPEYAIGNRVSHNFQLDQKAIERDGCKVYFSACERVDKNQYRTVGNSRVVALLGEASTPAQVRERILKCIRKHVTGPLQYRSDVGSEENIARISSLVHS